MPNLLTLSAKLTPEQKLQAIVKAQVKGGCKKYKILLDPSYILSIPEDAEYIYSEKKNEGYAQKISEDDLIFGTAGCFNILSILFKPEGLKAAYPGRTCEDCNWTQCPPKESHPFSEPYYPFVAEKILDKWLSSSGNAIASINTAFSLLPDNDK